MVVLRCALGASFQARPVTQFVQFSIQGHNIYKMNEHFVEPF